MEILKSINIVRGLILVLPLLAFSCKDKETVEETKPNTFTPTPYPLTGASYFLQPAIADTNKLTVEGVELGRHLFYEEMLSINNTQSCNSCHIQEYGFSDPRPVSPGAEGARGTRNSMALVNLAWQDIFFWDGRSNSLEHQVLKPIQDPNEMNQSLDQTISKLKATTEYPELFKKAFGTPDITTGRISMALAQFVKSLVSSNSRYDQYLQGTLDLTDQELRGKNLFFAHPDFRAGIRGGNCGDCHLNGSVASFKGLRGFKNNGVQLNPNVANYDKGLELTTGNAADRGKMKIPSLRNIALTAPYMHDGRFATLEQVIGHYNNPNLFNVPHIDSLILTGKNEQFRNSLALRPDEVADIVAFMQTLTDVSFINNPKYKDPKAQ